MTELGRLTRRPEYLRVAAARHKWATPGMVVQARPREQAETAPPAEAERPGARRRPAPDPAAVRYGLTVSRKVGNAVARNRVRRRLRALAREVLPAAGEPGTDYVLIGRAGTRTRAYADLRADLLAALDRLDRGRGKAGSGAPGGGRRRGGRRRSKRGGDAARTDTARTDTARTDTEPPAR